MGWLEELAKGRGHKSLRALALAMHESEHWPAGDTRSPRTVENKLHHADEGTDPGWWLRTGRPFLRALAEVLEEDEDELLHRLQNTRPPASDQSAVFWPFKVFPELRPIDFDSEDPFPGVPPALLRIGGPRELRTWWVAPTGAGKTLVGQWLAARYDWTFIRAQSWSDIKIPTHGRVFIELSSITGICVHVLQKIPSTVTICVACPNLPLKKQVDEQSNGYDHDWMLRPNFAREPTLMADLPPEFSILYTSPAGVWGDDLLQWVAKRVNPGGGFNVDQAHELLFHTNMHTLFETPGELIGFLGVVEQVGLARSDANQSASIVYMRWIGIWLKSVSERFVHEYPTAETPEFRRKRGVEVLRDIEMERLRRGFEPLLAEAQWCDLIPRGHSPELDRERFAELKAIGVLVECDAERLRIKPVWLANALQVVAIERLYDDAPDGLGSLLLYNNTSEHALRRLIDEVCAGNSRCIEACLKAGEPSTPEQMVALDGVFRAIGIALLKDISVPIDWVHEIWIKQMRHTVQRYNNWPPIPILQIAEQGHYGPTSTRGWFFAAFSISRTLTHAGREIGRSALNPWCGLPEDAGERASCIEALSSIGWIGRANDERADLDPVALLVYRLGAALYEKVGILRRHGHLLELQGPDVLVALASKAKREFPESVGDSLHSLSFGLDALEDACKRHSVDLDDVLDWCWKKWGARADIWQCPPIRWLGRGGFGAKYADAKRVWKVVPVDALPMTFYQQLENVPEVWPYLTEMIWARWLDVWSRQEGRSHEGATIFRVLPETLALQAVRDGVVDPWAHEIRDVLWERMPAALLDLVDELAPLPPHPHPKVPDGGGPVVWLIYAAPAERCATLVQRARTWLQAPSKYPGVEGRVCRWLARVIEQRSAGWRDAYALIVEDAKASAAGQ